MSSHRHGEDSSTATEPGHRGLTGEVFDVIAERMLERSDMIALFSESTDSFEEWCAWEAFAACRAKGWDVRPKPRYATVGVSGSREAADLLVYDPATGGRVLVELAIVHDWTTNKWIDKLDGDTDRLGKALDDDIQPLQIVLVASTVSKVGVNVKWQRWLELSRIWKQPTDLVRGTPLGAGGELTAQGWVIQ